MAEPRSRPGPRTPRFHNRCRRSLVVRPYCCSPWLRYPPSIPSFLQVPTAVIPSHATRSDQVPMLRYLSYCSSVMAILVDGGCHSSVSYRAGVKSSRPGVLTTLDVESHISIHALPVSPFCALFSYPSHIIVKIPFFSCFPFPFSSLPPLFGISSHSLYLARSGICFLLYYILFNNNKQDS